MQQERDRDWRNVVFTDESWFELGDRRHWIWRHHDDYGPNVSYSKEAHPKKVMVWGAIGHNFKSSLHFCSGTVNGEYYYDEIIGGGFLDEADAAFGHMDWILQQDNARPHVRKDIVEAMEYLRIRILKPWPPYSPDLNIIERIWAIMKRRIERHHSPIRTVAQLREVVQNVWAELTIDTINALVEEMPRRLIAVIRNGGHTIQHI
jgi:enamine deaminase RidA (YjgF/YER057c/UK114 family)